MKKSILLCAVAISVSVLMSCASTKQTKVLGMDQEEVNWWESPLLAERKATKILGEEGIAAIGKSSLSGVACEKAARTDGRAALAQRIQTAVNDVTKVHTAGDNDRDSTETFSEEVEAIASTLLVGSEQLLQYVDEDTGITYVLMFMPFDALDKKFKSAAMKASSADLKEAMNNLTIDEFRASLYSQSDY